MCGSVCVACSFLGLVLVTITDQVLCRRVRCRCTCLSFASTVCKIEIGVHSQAMSVVWRVVCCTQVGLWFQF